MSGRKVRGKVRTRERGLEREAWKHGTADKRYDGLKRGCLFPVFVLLTYRKDKKHLLTIELSINSCQERVMAAVILKDDRFLTILCRKRLDDGPMTARETAPTNVMSVILYLNRCTTRAC